MEHIESTRVSSYFSSSCQEVQDGTVVLRCVGPRNFYYLVRSLPIERCRIHLDETNRIHWTQAWISSFGQCKPSLLFDFRKKQSIEIWSPTTKQRDQIDALFDLVGMRNNRS